MCISHVSLREDEFVMRSVTHQLHQHLLDLIGDKVLGVIQENVSILSLQCGAVITGSQGRHNNVND